LARLRVSIRHRFQKNLKQKSFFHHAVWHVFLAKKWPVYKKSLRENGSWQPETVFRYGMSRKFAIIPYGFWRNLNFELSEKFPWGPPFAEF
ncbi:MAG: hypothetical protein AAFW00_28955, partial [Bacteroidota bacterium]